MSESRPAPSLTELARISGILERSPGKKKSEKVISEWIIFGWWLCLISIQRHFGSHYLKVDSANYWINHYSSDNLISFRNTYGDSTIIERDWKFRDLSVASKSMIFLSLWLWLMIYLWDTDKSQYFAITKFNNYCFIIRSPFFWSTKYHLWQNTYL